MGTVHKIEQIVANIVTALEAITTVNGYNVDVTTVFRPTRLGDYGRTSPGSYTIALTLGDPTRADELDTLNNPAQIGWLQSIRLDLVYRPSDAATVAIEKQLNQFWADVGKAMFVDPTWSAKALDTKYGDSDYWINEADGTCGMTALFLIDYRHKETDPTV